MLLDQLDGGGSGGGGRRGIQRLELEAEARALALILEAVAAVHRVVPEIKQNVVENEELIIAKDNF